jgi:glyoxylase-like metal-dependent hydrolase (beta-lactamase superfamily II)
VAPEWTLHPLVLGEADVPKVLDAMWSLVRDKGIVSVPILAWLLRPVTDGDPILVDTGFRDAQRCVDVQHLGPHRSRPEWSLEAQLDACGVALADIHRVLLTHLHYDHAGQVELLLNARFVVQRTELMAAAAPMITPHLDFGGGALFYDRKDIAALVDPLWARVQLIEGDEEIEPGVRCVLFANTHTPGSQVIYVHTADGVAGILGDLGRNVEMNVEHGIPPGLYYDLEATRRAMERIRREIDIPLPSHDPNLLVRFGSRAVGSAGSRDDAA